MMSGGTAGQKQAAGCDQGGDGFAHSSSFNADLDVVCRPNAVPTDVARPRSVE
jgi:hypothetical protein